MEPLFGSPLDTCGSLIALAATGLVTVATCVSIVWLALKHGYVAICPIQLSIAGSAPPCRLVSRIGFSFVGLFMVSWAPGISKAFLGGTSQDNLCNGPCDSLQTWFTAWPVISGVAVAVQGVMVLLKRVNPNQANDSSRAIIVRKVHSAAVLVMFAGVQVLYCSAGSLLWLEYWRNPAVPAQRLLAVMFAPIALSRTFALSLWGRGDPGARAQWTAVVLVISVFAVLGTDIVLYTEEELQCNDVPGSLRATLALCGLALATAILMGYKHEPDPTDRATWQSDWQDLRLMPLLQAV